MLSKERIYAIIDKALLLAEGQIAQVQVSCSATGLSRIAHSQIHQNVFEDRALLHVTVYEPRKSCTISTNVLSDEGIAAAVKQAISNLSFLPDGEEQPELVSTPVEMETLLFNQELHDAFGVEARATMLNDELKALPGAFKAYGQLSYGAQARGMGNTTGMRRFVNGNYVRFAVIVADGYDSGAGFSEVGATSLEEVNLAGTLATALQKAQLNRNLIEIPPGAYTLILEPLAVNYLMPTIIGSFSGAAVLSKRSPLTDRIGERIFSDKLNIVDDWTSPLVPGIAFDGQGTPRRKLTLVEKGVPRELAYDITSAKRAGVSSTGHANVMVTAHAQSLMSGRSRSGASPSNVIVAGGDKPLAQIIAETDKAILVTRFWYERSVNARQAVMTGLTRDGLFMIENGRITNALHNMRWTESLLLAFNQIEEISSDHKRISRFGGGSIGSATYLPGMKIRDFHFTGNTTLS